MAPVTALLQNFEHFAVMSNVVEEFLSIFVIEPSSLLVWLFRVFLCCA